MSTRCECGHQRDDHDPGDGTPRMYEPCEVEGCGCLDFEADHAYEEQDEEDDDE